MLTTLQHHFTLHLTDPHERQVYFTYTCGLCHALGDGYGLSFRLITSHELILLNLLTSAQSADEPVITKRRCPLNPLLKVFANWDIASQLAAAVAVELANVQFADDVRDSGGRDVTGRVGVWMLQGPHRTALQVLSSLGVDVEILTQLGEQQALAESDESQDPAGPTAQVSAVLFAVTARLAGRPENVEPLAAIGASFGAYIYLLDAYRDFARDMQRGEFNPLRRFSDSSADDVVLSRAGLEWLLSRFEMIQGSIRKNTPRLHLYRHSELLTKLLADPVDKIVRELSHRIQQPELTLRRWQGLDVLRAGLFMLPFASYSDDISDCGLNRCSNLCGNNDRSKPRGENNTSDCISSNCDFYSNCASYCLGYPGG